MEINLILKYKLIVIIFNNLKKLGLKIYFVFLILIVINKLFVLKIIFIKKKYKKLLILGKKIILGENK